MDNFAAAISAIEDLKRQAIIEEYAVGGAMALTFWAEPTTTFDLDVFVLLRSDSDSDLVTLEPIYRWARERGYQAKSEHIIIQSLPVQILPAPTPLAREAVTEAVELDYAGQPVRVIRPEYLIALALDGSARTRKRLARVAMLLEEAELDHELLTQLLERYNLRLPEFS